MRSLHDIYEDYLAVIEDDDEFNRDEYSDEFVIRCKSMHREELLMNMDKIHVAIESFRNQIGLDKQANRLEKIIKTI